MRTLSGGDHLCHTVGDRAALVSALRLLVKQLPTRDGIFVHRYSDDEARRLLEEAGAGPSLLDGGSLTVVGRVAAFQNNGPRIDPGHVSETVERACDAAEARGRGLFILADASHAYLSEGRAAEWFAFEVALQRRLRRDVVLVCLYWDQDVQDPDTAAHMQAAHIAKVEETRVPL